LEYKRVTQTIRKQRKSGLWGDNILGLAANKAQGIKDVGTIASYRHLLELGLPPSHRVFRQADRVLYRLLSRDDALDLTCEYKAAAKQKNEGLIRWSRAIFREGATVALAHGKKAEDPRVRGAAHRIVTEVSQFLRSEFAEKPFIKKGSRNILHPEAYPPTFMSVALLAYMPSLLRERAGFVDRLCAYLAAPPTKRQYVLIFGRKVVQPTYNLLGNPVEADRLGNPKDLPLALMWIEMLSRMGTLHTNEIAQRVLAKLLSDLDESGVWSPRNLRAFPKSKSKAADYAFPLELDAKTLERRQADVTFRLALIAKLCGWELEYT
jgi:hypothetical protein